jgi:plastocyanin
MSIMGRRVPIRVVVLVVVCLIVGTLIPVLSRSEVREIQLVVRDMAFYLADDPQTANPTITVKAGETVHLVVRNDDRGVRHDFALPIADASTRMLAFGEQGEVTLTVPSQPGTYEYVCRPHRAMMRGIITIVR